VPPEITYDEIRMVVVLLRREAARLKEDLPA